MALVLALAGAGALYQCRAMGVAMMNGDSKPRIAVLRMCFIAR